MIPPPSARAVRFAVGSGLLTFANDLVVFVSPAGPVADRWSDIAQTPASSTEIQAALRTELPKNHHVALLHLVDGGAVLLAAAGDEPINGSIQLSVEGVIRFGMPVGGDIGYWIGAGAVGASGFEVTGFAIVESDMSPEVVPSSASPDGAPAAAGTVVDSPPTPRSEFFADRPSHQPPPPLATDRDPARPLHSPVAPQPTADRPLLRSALFADLPTETDPPTGIRPSLSVRFDDGLEVPLEQELAVGRAPEGSAEVRDGTVIVVVSGDQVSRCHFVIRPRNGGAEVIDTNSLNGCFLDDADRPGSGPQIPVGVPVRIEPGQQLRFGDRSFTLIAGSQAT